MFKQIMQSIGADKDYPARALLIDMYTRVLEGRLYDHLQYAFCQEYDGQGNYIQLRDRRPSVKYNICRIVVDDSVSLTFGNDHFPSIVCKDESIVDFAKDLIEETSLNSIMMEAATYGAVGSVVIVMRIYNGKVFWEVKTTQYLTPTYDPENPRCLIKLTEKFKVKGSELIELGYGIKEQEKNQDFWFLREWNAQDEVYYKPYKVADKKAKPVVDKQRTFHHGLGFVPAVWLKNLPKPGSIDGWCSFALAIDTNIEIDYQLSQGGRGLKYASDPTIILKLDDQMSFTDNNGMDVAQTITLNDGSSASIQGFPAGSSGKRVIRSANNALTVGKDENVDLLEISGAAAKAVMDFARCLREYALESMHGNRANADKVNAAQSGRAQKEMNQALIWLADKLRISYGDEGLIKLIEMVVKATHVFDVCVNGVSYKNLNANEKITPKWPNWYPSTPQDLVQIATATKIHTDTGHMSKETAIKNIAEDYGVKDVDLEMKKIDEDQAKINALNPKVNEIIQA
jgi:hypothetical protein